MKLESTNILIEDQEKFVKIIIRLEKGSFISFVCDKYRIEELKELLDDFFNFLWKK